MAKSDAAAPVKKTVKHRMVQRVRWIVREIAQGSLEAYLNGLADHWEVVTIADGSGTRTGHVLVICRETYEDTVEYVERS